MGRQKIVIKKQDWAAQRRATFKKRSNGLKKKADEISVLSDAKVMLLMHSPKGGYDLFLGKHNTFDDIVQQFLSESQEKRNKSWQRSMEVLEKAFKGDVESSEVLMAHYGMSPKKAQGSQKRELASIKEEISKLETQLGPLRNINEIDKIESFGELEATKNLIQELLAKNEREKEIFIEQQRSGCHNFTVPYTRDLRCSTSTAATDPPECIRAMHRYFAFMSNFTSPYQGDLGCSTSTAVPAPTYPCVPAPTDPYMHPMNQQGTLVSNSTTPYQGVNFGYTASTGIPLTSDPCTSGMQQLASMPYPTTSPYQRVSRGSTSTAVPIPTHPSMQGMDQQAEVVPVSTSLFHSGDAICSTSSAGFWSNLLHQRDDQEELLMPNLQELMSELEKGRAA